MLMYDTGSILNADGSEVEAADVDKEHFLPIRCLRPRETGVRYEVEHHDQHFYFVTNKDNARNNKLMVSPVSDYFPGESNSEERRAAQLVQWRDVRAYDQCEQIEDILPFRDFVAIFGRKKGIQQLWIMDLTDKSSTRNHTL